MPQLALSLPHTSTAANLLKNISKALPQAQMKPFTRTTLRTLIEFVAPANNNMIVQMGEEYPNSFQNLLFYHDGFSN